MLIINKMPLITDVIEAVRFACTLSFWRMSIHWTYALVLSYIHLFIQTTFSQKSVYHHSVVSPLPPLTPSKTSNKHLPICIITGASSGLGAAAAHVLSKKGFHVVLVGRSLHKLSKVMSDIKCGNEQVQLKAFEVDLSNFSSIMKFKESLEQWLLESDMHPSIQLLINNAGMLAITSRLTTQGHDLMMGTNYIGPFCLTQVLLPFLKNSPIPSRIVNVTSFTHRIVSSFRADKETVSGNFYSKYKQYPCAEIYEYSKLCMLLLSYELHRQLHTSQESQNVSVIGVDPGSVKTNIMREVPWCISEIAYIVLGFLHLLQSPEAGVSAVIDAALSPPETSGLYFFGGSGRTVGSSALSYNLKLSKELWDTSCGLFEASVVNYKKVLDSVSSEKVE
ncbi:hypothetical protein LXL04_001617 [Taraxacum kok-saghyz]